MSGYICKKPIMLSGISFSSGEIIPEGLVLPQRVLALARSNYIVEMEGGLLQEEAVTPILPFQGENGDTLITIPISTKNGILEVTTSSQVVTTVFTIMQKKVEDAEKDIAELDDEDTLIILNAVDSRKGIKKAAEERNAQLNEIPGTEAIETEDQEKDGA